MAHPKFQIHEYDANYIFTDHGRQPYFAIGQLIDAYDGATTITTETPDGTQWSIELKYQIGNLKPKPEDDIPDDTAMHEYWVKARPIEDSDHTKATYHISPRWKDQIQINGNEFNSPFDHDTVTIDGEKHSMPNEGINVKAQCSNLSPYRADNLFQTFIHELARNADTYFDYDYFENYHPMSNVIQIEGYVRHTRATQSKLVETDGVLMRMMHLLGDREGTQISYDADNTDIVGYLHKLKINHDDATHLIDGHQYGKQFKSYHPKHVFDDASHPLYHPKFGILIKNAWNDDTLHVHNVQDMKREIEEAGTNVLSWAGIDSDPNDGPWVSDDHFTPTSSNIHIDMHPNPLPEIEARQESHLLRIFTHSTDADRDILAELANSDGEEHHAMLEDATGYSSSTLYRMLQRIPELVDSDNGIIKFQSQKLQDDIKDILERTTNVVESGVDAIANMLGVDAQLIQSAEGKLTRFVQKYAADIREKHDGKMLLVKLNAVATELPSMENEGYTHIARIADELERMLRTTHRYDTANRVDVEWTTPNGSTKRRRLDSPTLRHLA